MSRAGLDLEESYYLDFLSSVITRESNTMPLTLAQGFLLAPYEHLYWDRFSHSGSFDLSYEIWWAELESQRGREGLQKWVFGWSFTALYELFL
jgi:hypothetical protein